METKKYIEAGLIIETFGRQIDIAANREVAYQDDPARLSELWGELRGHENEIMAITHWVRTRERINLGHMYGFEIGATLDTIKDDIWDKLTDPHYDDFEDLED